MTVRGDRSSHDPSRPATDAEARTDDTGPARAIVCAACSHALAPTTARITVRGEHEHVCVNPSGIPYHIGCFRDAPGTVSHGAEESFFSWFEGTRWRIALCAGCGAHVGWSFHGDGTFFGLVLARVREAD